MAGSGPQQASPPHAESVNVRQPDELINFERENHVDNQREGSSRTTHVGRSGYRRKSHLVQEHADEQDLQHEIDDLKKKLRRAQRNHIPSNSDTSSTDEEGDGYRNSSETPPSESYSCEEERSLKRRRKSPSRKGAGAKQMKRALTQISKSPFTRGIERARLPRRFHQPTFSMYNGRTDPVEHVSQFRQKMAVYSQDEALLCRVFPSSLGPMPMRWFDGLKTNSISSFKKLTQSFCSRFIACSRAPRPLDSLLSMTMREGETVRSYAERYWEVFNEIDGDFEEVAVRTFKVGLPSEHGLRKSLTGKPVTNLQQLMDRVDKYKRIEDDQQQQQQGKGKTKLVPQERREFRPDRYNNNRPRRDYAEQQASSNNQIVGAVFREPVHQVLEKIKNEPFFKWPNKMMGNPERRNRSLYCQYHRDHGHTTEDCRSLWDHLDQLVREGRLKQLLHHSNSLGTLTDTRSERGNPPGPPLGIINVIFAAPGRTGSCPSRVMSVARLYPEDDSHESKRVKLSRPLVIGFSDEDKIGTVQPHDDALVITLRIGGYDVKRVMVDQGSAAEIMYPDLFKGLNLRAEDLTPYASPLVSFEGRTIIPRGQIRLPVQAGTEVVEVDFIVVDAYSPYTAIVARPWLHALGAVSSTLHQKIKYPSGDKIAEILGDQTVARQCMIAAIRHEPEAESGARKEEL